MAEFHSITDMHKEMLEALNKCTMLPGSWDKRFCRNLQGARELSERQANCIEVMYHRYRKQIVGHERLCTVCCKQDKQGSFWT